MTGFEVKVIVWVVQDGWHDATKIRTAFTIVGLTKLDTRNLGYCIGFIGRLQHADQQADFADWLPGIRRVNAETSKK